MMAHKKFKDLPDEDARLLDSLEDLGGEIFLQDGLLYFKDPEDKNPFTIDFLKGDMLFRLKSSGKKQPLLKALDISNNKKILDLTAGLGRDALTLSYHGCAVVALERHPLLFLMLKYAYEDFKADSFFNKMKGTLNFEFAEAFDFLKQSDQKWDAVYLDPMYPHEEKSAKSKKDVEFLKKFASPTDDLQGLVEIALSKAMNRVVLKRPTGAKCIGTPQHQVEGNLVRFDIYFPKAIQ